MEGEVAREDKELKIANFDCVFVKCYNLFRCFYTDVIYLFSYVVFNSFNFVC